MPRAPLVPVVANISAAKMPPNPAVIVRTAGRNRSPATVRWRESVEAMAAMGVDSFIELGAGRVLAGLVRRIAPDAAAVSAGTPAEIEQFLKQF